jgi:hypothetical protein
LSHHIISAIIRTNAISQSHSGNKPIIIQYQLHLRRYRLHQRLLCLR